jgi:ParB family chromosome partitioning protein
LYPDDVAALGDAKWIVVNGCRRLAAAAKYGRDGLDVIIRDSLAGDAATILWAAIVENIDRRDFDIIEEARAVDLLATEAGSGAAAAERLGRTKAWVSQRRALLKLAPDLQDKLRNGELAFREARNLARIPLPEQIARWQAAHDQRGRGGEDKERPPATRPDTTPARPEAFVRAFRRLRAEPATVATAAREIFTVDELRELVDLLTGEQST